MKLFYKILFLSLLFLPNVNAGTGPASEYKITMTLLELCDSTSSLTACNNPVVISSGSSGVVDIAGTTAGEAAASYGNLSTVPIGTTFTHMQITMNRSITATGSANDTQGTPVQCFTNSSAATAASKTSNASGHASTASSATLFMGFIGTVNGDATNSATAGDGTGTSRAATTVTSADEFLEHRVALTTPLTIKAGQFPTVKIAFGTDNAIGAQGDMETSAACDTGSPSIGLFGAAPDVTITFE